MELEDSDSSECFSILSGAAEVDINIVDESRWPHAYLLIEPFLLYALNQAKAMHMFVLPRSSVKKEAAFRYKLSLLDDLKE